MKIAVAVTPAHAGVHVSPEEAGFPSADGNDRQEVIFDGASMGLWFTHRHENRLGPALVQRIQHGTVKVVRALDELRPFLSVAWNARFAPMSVTSHFARGAYVVVYACATRGLTYMHKSCIVAHMRTTLIIDENLVERARQLTGIRKKTALVHAGLEALIARQAARRLAALGGAEPRLRSVRRRRAGATR